MTNYVLAPAVITTMLLSLMTVLFVYADEPEHILPLVHVSVIVCICLMMYCLFLKSLS